MSRVPSALIAALLAVALVAGLPGACGCAMHAPVEPGSGHGCCTSVVGLRVAASGCCEAAPDGDDAAIVSVGTTAAVTTLAAALSPAHVVHASARLETPPLVPVHAPPPAILRL